MSSIWAFIASIYTSGYAWHQSLGYKIEAMMPIAYTYGSPIVVCATIILLGVFMKHANTQQWHASKKESYIFSIIGYGMLTALGGPLALFLLWGGLGILVAAVPPILALVVSVWSMLSIGGYLYNVVYSIVCKFKTSKVLPTAIVHGGKK